MHKRALHKVTPLVSVLAGIITTVLSLPILAAICPLVCRLHSPVLARFVSAALLAGLALSIMVTDEGMNGIILLMNASKLIALQQIIQHYGRAEQQNIVNEIGKPAVLELIIFIFCLTFTDQIDDTLDFNFVTPSTNGYLESGRN